MSLRLFNLFGAGRPVTRSTGMVLATASRSVERHQTAFRGPAPSPSGGAAAGPKPGAPETSPCRQGGHSKRVARSPGGVTALAGEAAGALRPPVRRWSPPKAASAQLDIDSPAGPHR